MALAVWEWSNLTAISYSTTTPTVSIAVPSLYPPVGYAYTATAPDPSVNECGLYVDYGSVATTDAVYRLGLTVKSYDRGTRNLVVGIPASGLPEATYRRFTLYYRSMEESGAVPQ